ncbi:MAG TPA: PDDEXK nuclease domain-containing protein [Isosphaeraceae bacterium]|jgi:predicted nuclease of restriction endonuclease-like (RecB) superfamily|nr:PDDEXK nuclease domain-containing protein [Isosphaeraceae bacterium]
MAKKRAENNGPARAAGRPPEGYAALLGELKERIRSARLRAALAVNRELVLLYWQIGREILARQGAEGWGTKVIDRLAADLRLEFPDMTGLSARNLKYMRAFGAAWPDEAIVQQAAAQIPWFHNCILLDKLKSPEERLWYIRSTIEHGWSRNVLVMWIESGLYHRQGKATTNFARSLPPPRSDLAGELLKDPYHFEFLGLADEAEERAIQRGLLQHVRRFLVELGAGFAFVGQEYRLEVGGEDFFIDLLFYHLKLRCFVVIELKATPFRPEHAGKMNFYLSAVDDLLRHPDDGPSIGIILCKSRNRVVAEYALRDLAKPVGVAGFITRLVESLPPALLEDLPGPRGHEADSG